MATPKTSVKVRPANTVLVEELRVLKNELENDEEVNGFLDWFSPDFWATAAAAVTNIVAVAAVLGWVSADKVEGLTTSIVALVGAAEVIFVNSALVWKFLTGREAVRAQIIESRLRLREAVIHSRAR